MLISDVDFWKLSGDVIESQGDFMKRVLDDKMLNSYFRNILQSLYK